LSFLACFQKAESLVEKTFIQPLYIEGFKKASEKAQEILDKIAIPILLMMTKL